MKALIDGDIVLYRSAFAAERAEYQLHQEGKDSVTFPSKAELTAYCKTHGISDFTAERKRIVEPLENALGNTKEILEKILDVLETNTFDVFLTGTGNYRRLIPSYKANRDPSMKPYWTAEVIEYMKKYWKATVVNGIEADDAIGIHHHYGDDKHKTVIVSTDKDLDTLPGWHYNWVKQELYEVSPDEANKNFWTQMLVGDNADNIRGVPGVGPKRAAAILGTSTSLYNTVELVENEYKKAFGEKWQREFDINYTLLNICLDEDEVKLFTERAKEYGKDIQRQAETNQDNTAPVEQGT